MMELIITNKGIRSGKEINKKSSEEANLSQSIMS